MQSKFDDTKILDGAQQGQKKPGKVKEMIEMIKKLMKQKQMAKKPNSERTSN